MRKYTDLTEDAFTHRVMFNNTKFHLQGEMLQWCHDNIGEGGWSIFEDTLWRVNSMFGNSEFMFREEKDCMWFKLRWGA